MDGETPAVVDDQDQDDQATAADAAAAAADGDGDQANPDVQEAVVEIDAADLGTDPDEDDPLFSGVEDAEGSSDADDEDDADDADEQDALAGVADGLDGNAAAMEDAINEGAARAAVIGLTDEDFEDADLDKDGLREEFEETFQAFRLGYFGSRAVEDYVLEPADGDVDPIWGLAGSALIACAMVVWLRPDGDQAAAKAREAIGGLQGAVA
jgi:hypothetical protein